MSNLRKQWEKRGPPASAGASGPIVPGQLLAKADQTLRAGRPEDAIDLCREILASTPDDLMVLGLLGIALAAARRFEESAATFQNLLKRQPGHLHATIGLARAKAALGERDAAIGLLQEAERRMPSVFEVDLHLADAYLGLGETAEGLRMLEKMDSARPNDPTIMFKKAHALGILKRPSDSLREYLRLLQLHSNIPHAHANAGAIYFEQGRYEEARREYSSAIRLAGTNNAGFQFLHAGLTPIIFESNEQIDDVRQTMRKEFDSLRLNRVRLRDPFTEVGATNSYNTYHGRPNKDLQQAIAKAYLAACPDLAWEAPSVSKKEISPGKIRLGVCSAFMWEHTIGRVMLGLLRKLDRSKFEVLLFRVGRTMDALGRSLDEAADRTVTLDADLRTARNTLAEAELDVLLYTEFGAEPLTSFLAYSRLAPVQVVAWGFPDTSGVPNLDYYASTAVFEPEGAQDHYSETLMALPRLYSYMYPPELSMETCTKQELGLRENERLYLCAQSLFKVHPDFDEAIKMVLSADPLGRVGFFMSKEEHWIDLLRGRFARTLGQLTDRVLFLPHLPIGKFQGALTLADALIDTPHFTGGYTTYLAFANKAPVVTWNGDLMRGRMTQGLYKLMEMEPLSADTNEEFAQLAVRLGTDRDFKCGLQAEIGDRAKRLFYDESAVRDFERFLIAAREAATQGKKLASWGEVA